MKTPHKVMATHMSYARRPVSLRVILAAVALATFVIGGGIFVAANLTATTTPKPGRITVYIQSMQQFKTAAPVIP